MLNFNTTVHITVSVLYSIDKIYHIVCFRNCHSLYTKTAGVICLLKMLLTVILVYCKTNKQTNKKEKKGNVHHNQGFISVQCALSFLGLFSAAGDESAFLLCPLNNSSTLSPESCLTACTGRHNPLSGRWGSSAAPQDGCTIYFQSDFLTECQRY